MINIDEIYRQVVSNRGEKFKAVTSLQETENAGKFEWIVNEPETADESSPIGGSWKQVWKQNGNPESGEINEWPRECSVSHCTRKAEHGAHVRDENGKVFIVPMCAKDNNPHYKEEMRLNKDTIMVEVKV